MDSGHAKDATLHELTLKIKFKMDLFAPVSTLMTDHKHLVTVDPDTPLLEVKNIFEQHRFHHIPVVHFRSVVGIISKSNYEFFMGGISMADLDKLETTPASVIMTKGLATLSPDTRINVAIEIFITNRLHALPIVQDDDLVGILTPHDILLALSKEKLANPLAAYEHQTP
jgi:acetoin utilization protein AcuB